MNYNDIQAIRVSEIRSLAVGSYDSLLSDLIEPKATTDAQRLGSFIHALVLQDDMNNIPTNLKVLEYENWRTKEAQNAKKEYESNQDVIPILSNEFDNIQKVLNPIKQHLKDIFSGGKFEIAHTGELENFGAIKGRLDCIKDDYVIDLKCTSQLANLDKKIFDMGYQLQMYLYMMLSNINKAKLVFLNIKTGLIEIKHLALATIKAECDVLLERAWVNKQKIEMYRAFNYIDIKESDYYPPQWALSELLKYEEE